jgi:integrase
MRTATRKLTNVTQRRKLPKRKKPYYVSVADRLCLGYLVRWPKSGLWYGRRKVLTEAGAYHDTIWRVAEADDIQPSNGVDVLSYGEAFARVAEGDPKKKTGAQYTVREAIADYLRHLKAEKNEAAAADGGGKLSKWILSHPLAAMSVNAVTVGQLETWRNSLIVYGEGDAPDPEVERRRKDTINRMLASFKAALNYARKQHRDTGVTSDAGWKELTRFKDVGARREVHFSIPQIRALIDASSPTFATLVQAGFFTGARFGELAALNVGDFDSHAGHLAVKGKQGGRKTGTRTITLTTEGIDFFRVLGKGRQANDPLLLAPGAKRWGDGDQTFPMRQAVVKAGLVTADALAGLSRTERPSFYSLRHSYISRALEHGMPIFLVAENVGTSIAMIQKNYGKFLHATKRKLIEQHAPKLHAEEMPHA